MRHAIALIGLLVAVSAQLCPAQRRTPLAPEPDWTRLDAYQGTITRAQFTKLLNDVFAPRDTWKKTIKIENDSAIIAKTITPASLYTLRFASGTTSPLASSARYWRPLHDLPAAPAGRPLEGLNIALDPGHIGGRWSQMEERWFRIDGGKPVVEGEMTLRVAQLLAPQLRALGAKVTLVRSSLEPVTNLRPQELTNEAKAAFADRGVAPVREFYAGYNDPNRGRTIQFERERLFYRVSEIRQRGALVNRVLKPDLVVCLHFNAEAWGDPAKPTLVSASHMHMIVNGCYDEGELDHDDIRLEMLLKLLSRSHDEELAASTRVGESLAAASGLPPYVYPGKNALRMNKWVWARNLLANRLFSCPVVYCEPYVMNSPGDYARMQAGDYQGTRNFGGTQRLSIYREYANAVAKGLGDYYAARGK
jgi:hypothetical protein